MEINKMNEQQLEVIKNLKLLADQLKVGVEEMQGGLTRVLLHPDAPIGEDDHIDCHASPEDGCSHESHRKQEDSIPF